ncbi:MAG: phosphate ABC transporter substrate-binding protein [Melioribacteraceae bacterium]|nr:phosphate ABC transporter substrate-binding protein [Melioribacteraceae bacterium]
MNFIKVYSLVLLVSLLLSCSSSRVEVAIIKIKGSDTMLPLTQILAEEYMVNNPGISIYVEGGGTSSGVKSLIRGETDICSASRGLKSDEARELADYYESLGMYYLIAKDALSIYVNPDNPVNNLSIGQLRDIFTCRINNWKQVGGKDLPVKLVGRNYNSGTFFYFKEHVLEGEEYCKSIEIEPTTADVIEYVLKNPNAIGYGGLNYGADVKMISVDNVRPEEENARNDKYPITRYLHFFTQRSPSGAVKNFIDWTLSPEGQKIIKKAGFIPLWQIKT